MAHAIGLDGILNRNAWILLTAALLFCGLCTCLIRLFLGLKIPVFAGLILAGIILVSTSGLRIIRTR